MDKEPSEHYTANVASQYGLVNKGDLKRMARRKNLLDDVTWVAEAEDFEDVRVLPLATWLKDRATEEAMNLYNQRKINLGDVGTYTKVLLRKEFSHAREFVRVDVLGYIHVGLNVDVVNEKALQRAVQLLFQVKTFEKGTFVEFGEPIQVYDDSKHIEI